MLFHIRTSFVLLMVAALWWIVLTILESRLRLHYIRKHGGLFTNTTFFIDLLKLFGGLVILGTGAVMHVYGR